MPGKLKVKVLAEKYNIKVVDAISELKKEGIVVKTSSSVIPVDMEDLVFEHFDEVYGNEKKDTKGSLDNEKEVHIKSPIIVRVLADTLNKKPNEIISKLMIMNKIATINQSIDNNVAIEVAKSFNINLVIDKREKQEHVETVNKKSKKKAKNTQDDSSKLVNRPPVVTFMGHVDHGKTSLQDKARATSVVSSEASGITQHIGASLINHKGKQITFIDTPGHAAFTSMRARGASITDIAILVVAADDGFMPQTIEAMKYAQEANVPIIVAINKMDLPGADPDKVLLHMQQNSLMSEDWGGSVGTARVSAMTGEGIDDLLERILLESEMLELLAEPNKKGEGVVIEAQLEQGLGSTTNILVTNGTFKIGDPIICGTAYGKIKAMINVNGERVKTAPPSTPIKLVGLTSVPETGGIVEVVKSEKIARKLSEANKAELKTEQNISETVNLEDLFGQIDDSKRNDLNIIIKGDVKGSCEAIEESLANLPSEKIKVKVIQKSVGAITERDVMLASTSKSILVGFHVRVNPGVNAMAKKESVDIRLYSIIYELLEDIEEALTGRLAPDKREINLGNAKILQIFPGKKGLKICGCIIESGQAKIGAKARVYRQSELIFNGEISSLRRFQDDVKEVKQGMECGIKLDNFLDFQENDIIEMYDVKLSKASL